jgi:hypothetical protein
MEDVMTLPIAHVDFTGPAPSVKVTVGNALPASYSVSVIPPDHDVSRQIEIAAASDPQEVDALHSLASVWPLKAGWVVSVIGGIGSIEGSTQYPVDVQLIAANNEATAFDITQVQGSSASTFLAMVELQGTP